MALGKNQGPLLETKMHNFSQLSSQGATEAHVWRLQWREEASTLPWVSPERTAHNAWQGQAVKRAIET